MLENQFIQFNIDIAPLKDEIAMQMKPGEAISFIVYDLVNDVKLVTPDGTREIGNVVYDKDKQNRFCRWYGYSVCYELFSWI